MKIGIRLHLAGLSFSNTASVFDTLSIKRCRTTVHNWVQKADLQPLDDGDPDHVTIDKTVIQLNDEWFWLYAAVDLDTNRLHPGQALYDEKSIDRQDVPRGTPRQTSRR